MGPLIWPAIIKFATEDLRPKPDVDRDIVIKLKDSLRIQWEKYFEEDKKIHLLAAAWLDPYWHTRWITPAVHQNPQELVKGG